MEDSRDLPRLLVVDDEPDLVDLYAAALGEDYDVQPAYGGSEALDSVREGADFDVALVDRRMPDVSGDFLTERLNSVVPECRVVMVTAVEPDFDVVEMSFDEYLVKPVSRSTVRETVDRLLRLKNYRERCREEYAVASKVAALRAHKTPAERAANEEYQVLVGRLAELRDELDRTTERFSTAEFAAAFAEIGDRQPQPTRSD